MEFKNYINTIFDEKQNKAGIIVDKNIDEKNIIKDIEKISMKNIKYEGLKEVSYYDGNKNKISDVKHFISFNNINLDLLKNILNTFYELLNDKENNINSIFDCLKTISYLFSNAVISTEQQNKIRGDLCEAILILKCRKELGIDITKNYQSNDNLYDFYFSKVKRNLEVKGTTKAKKEIVLDARQIVEGENRDFIVVEYQPVDDGMNLVQLYEEIGINSCQIIYEKYVSLKETMNLNKEYEKFINKKLRINLDSVNIFKYNDALIPKIKYDSNYIKAIKIILCTQNGFEKDFMYIKELV